MEDQPIISLPEQAPDVRLLKDLPFMAALVAGLIAIGRSNYLLFHSLVEAVIGAMAFIAFAFAWNSRRFEHGYLLLLGLLCGSTATFGILHSLSYKGMNVIPGASTNTAAQLWIASRYLFGAVLLIAPLFLKRRLPVPAALAALWSITGLLIYAILTHRFPDCFIDGQGQTAFKIASEYVISALLVVALCLMLRRRREFNSFSLWTLVGFFAFSIAAELAFTSYLDFYDVSSMIGHLLNLVATYLFYKAIVETGLTRPFELLFRDLNLALEASRRDITGRKLIEFELKQAIRSRDEFLSIAAHELKTPLTPLKLQIHNFQRALELGRLDAPNLERIQRMGRVSSRQIDRLTYLIESLLDVSRISSGKLNLRYDTVEIQGLMFEIVEKHQEQILASGCRVRVASRSAPVNGRLDSVRVEQVIANLLINALKYAPGSEVELGTLADEHGQALIWVRDSGGGIPAEAQARVFERFERAVSAFEISGLGLGLFICKQIVEAHGGTIHLQSRPGFGTLFEIRLPRQPMAERPLETSALI